MMLRDRFLSFVLATASVLAVASPISAQFDFFKEVSNAVQAVGDGVSHIVNEADKIAQQVRPVDIDFRNGGVTRFNWGGIAETRYDPRNGLWGPLEPGVIIRAPVDASASVAAQAIRYSRDRARAGSRPLPTWVRDVLSPFFPADVLANAHYSFDWGEAANFTVQQPILGNDRAIAISLIDTIIVKGRTLTTTDGYSYDMEQPGWHSVYLWAHEITHLVQYKTLGVEDFAKRMITDYYGALENPAQANGERVANLIDQAASRTIETRSTGNDAADVKCRRGSGAIFSVQYPRGQIYLFGDCRMDAYRYFPEYDRREDRPTGRIVPVGRGFAAVDPRGNTYFARLERYR